MKSICLILPWFGGPFKNYFQFFLESCKNNPSVYWLIFTDSKQDYDYPKNVLVHKCSFEYLKTRIQSLFDFKISLEKPYKLCDYRPAYGEIFADELNGYDYWGYCDCDLIFGNIRKFVTDEILEHYKMIFTRGHFHLFRNETETNVFYRTLNYKDVFSTDKSFTFDEWAGISGAWDKSGKDYYDELVMDDIRVGFRAFRPTKEISDKTGPYHRKNKNLSTVYKKMKDIHYLYDCGCLQRCYSFKGKTCLEECLYVHFQKRNLAVSQKQLLYNNFCIANNAFFGAFGNKCHLSLCDAFFDWLYILKMNSRQIVKFFVNRFRGI